MSKAIGGQQTKFILFDSEIQIFNKYLVLTVVYENLICFLLTAKKLKISYSGYCKNMYFTIKQNNPCLLSTEFYCLPFVSTWDFSGSMLLIFLIFVLSYYDLSFVTISA